MKVLKNKMKNELKIYQKTNKKAIKSYIKKICLIKYIIFFDSF